MPRLERPSMASYGVPADTEGALRWDWASQRLLRSRNYWLTTVDRACRPHSMPVWGVWTVDDDHFWFASASDSLKARNLESNPHVVVTADDTVEVVSIEGTALLVEARRDIARQFGDKYGDDESEQKQITGFFLSSTMYEVTPAKAFGLIEREEEFARTATRWVF